MQQKVLNALEYDKILEMIASRSNTSAAQNNIRSLTPDMSAFMINETLDLTAEAVVTISHKGALPCGGYKEITQYVLHAQKGGTIRGRGLLAVSSAIKYASQIKRFIFSEEYGAPTCERLNETASEITELKTLASSIDSCILGEDEIADGASPALAAIRRKMRRLNSGIRDKLSSYTKGDSSKYLQEQLVTMRSGRYVIPVKSEFRSTVDGIIHDTSASGLTLFVEPQSIVNMNNELRALEADEAREIDEILSDFSSRVAEKALELIANEKAVILLDEIFAKASYAYDNGYTRPAITEERFVSLLKARHPLIDRKKAVASDIVIGRDYTQIVITGPNTGGKTVALKTLGLSLLMAQSGLFVPAEEGSTVCLFTEVFADIGDEQSIEQSLSTFSSHMTNIAAILKELDEDSMVLLDELGAGTDPSEGAALAKSILKYIRASGAMCVATTHYSEIKQYALTEPGIVNANVEFDAVNLKPTFRLTIGLPGKSNAFEISSRLGIPQEIIEEAKKEMTVSDSRFEELISSLTRKNKDAEDFLMRAKTAWTEAEKAEAEKQSELERLKETKNRLYTEAVVESKQIINNAKKTAREMISSADRYSKGSGAMREESSRMAKEALDELNALLPKSSLFSSLTEEGEGEHEFSKGDSVSIPELKAEGSIVEIRGESALVQIGSIKTTVALSKLKPAAAKKEKNFAYTGMKAASFSPTLDIRGITGEEAKIEVDKFIDDAILAGYKTLTIIHGKGEGVLRRKVTEVLKTSDAVESFRLGGLSEGAGGATIVYLK